MTNVVKIDGKNSSGTRTSITVDRWLYCLYSSSVKGGETTTKKDVRYMIKHDCTSVSINHHLMTALAKPSVIYSAKQMMIDKGYMKLVLSDE